MAGGDLEQLMEMGFDKERAELSLKKGRSLQDAIDWLDSNSATPLEDLMEDSAEAGLVDLQPGAEAKSLVCNECGKMFRSTIYAEAHAERSGHTDFSESTEEIAPLTQEEKKAKLSELREKLAAKRGELSEQDKIDKKRNEEINRKKTKETQDLKEELKKKEQIKDAENKRKEKQADIEAKKRIQAKIAADKEERRLRAEREKAEREGRAAAVPSTAPAAAAIPVSSKPASAYTETRLRLQTASGNVIKTYPVETTLFEVAAELNNESGLEVESFTQNFPKKTFNRDFFGETLKELKLIPSASLIVK